MVDQERSLKRAQKQLGEILIRLTPAQRDAFMTGRIAFDLGGGWQVLADPPNNTLVYTRNPGIPVLSGSEILRGKLSGSVAPGPKRPRAQR